MRIVHLHPGPDTGGQSMAGKRYLEAAGHEVRVFAAPHRFEYDLPEPWDLATVNRAVDRADVVVIHNDVSVLDGVSGWSGKRIVMHHHGSHFRSRPEAIYAAGDAIGAVQVVSTVDLLLSLPEGGVALWFPQVIDVAKMEDIRMGERVHSKPRPLVTHAPTNRRIKGTRHVVDASMELYGEVDVQVIVHQPWEVCLRLKARSDVFVDQLKLGYGNNAIEAWAMGLPVIAGAPDEIIEAMRGVYGQVPFYRTSPECLADDIRTMLREPVVRDTWIDVGQAHVQRFHAPEAWTSHALAVYG